MLAVTCNEKSKYYKNTKQYKINIKNLRNNNNKIKEKEKEKNTIDSHRELTHSL